MNPVHNYPPYFPKIHSNTILLPTPMSYEWSLPFKFCGQSFSMHFSSLPCMLREASKLWSSSLCSLLQPPATYFFLDPIILLSTLFSRTFNLCPSLSVRDQVSHPYNTIYTAWKKLCIKNYKFHEMCSEHHDLCTLYFCSTNEASQNSSRSVRQQKVERKVTRPMQTTSHVKTCENLW
jgi:hypothetical protein